MLKFIHIRKLNRDNTISSKGGITIAYSCTKKDIILSFARCRYDDIFCKETGRLEAAKRMTGEVGPDLILPLEHPIQKNIAKAIEEKLKIKLVWETPIVKINDFISKAASHKRWLSRFKPT